MVTKAEGMNFWRYGFDYENRLVTASTRKQTLRYPLVPNTPEVRRYRGRFLNGNKPVGIYSDIVSTVTIP